MTPFCAPTFIWNSERNLNFKFGALLHKFKQFLRLIGTWLQVVSGDICCAALFVIQHPPDRNTKMNDPQRRHTRCSPPKKARGDLSNIFIAGQIFVQSECLETKSTNLNLIFKMAARGPGSHGVTIGLSEQLAAIFISFVFPELRERPQMGRVSIYGQREERKAVHCSRLAFSHTAAKWRPSCRLFRLGSQHPVFLPCHRFSPIFLMIGINAVALWSNFPLWRRLAASNHFSTKNSST